LKHALVKWSVSLLTKETALRTIVIVSAALLSFCVVGCSGTDNDRSGANLPGYSGGGSSAATSQDYNQKPAPTSDPEASGGSTLAASTPFKANGPAISQNLNPAPFMGSGTAGQGDANSGRSVILSSNRTMGTVEGPSDQPAAGIGPGMLGQSSSGSFRGPGFSGSGRKSTAGENIPGGQSTQPASPK
jgi:hypothetical protein